MACNLQFQVLSDGQTIQKFYPKKKSLHHGGDDDCFGDHNIPSHCVYDLLFQESEAIKAKNDVPNK